MSECEELKKNHVLYMSDTSMITCILPPVKELSWLFSKGI